MIKWYHNVNESKHSDKVEFLYKKSNATQALNDVFSLWMN